MKIFTDTGVPINSHLGSPVAISYYHKTKILNQEKKVIYTVLHLKNVQLYLDYCAMISVQPSR